MARQTLWAHAFLDTPYSISSSERAIESSHRSPRGNTQYSQETDFHAPDGILTLDSSKRATTDSCRTSHSHRDQHNIDLYIIVSYSTLYYTILHTSILHREHSVRYTEKSEVIVVEGIKSCLLL
jgi:hypothetical protein